MIDFHCHVDLFPDPTEVICESEKKGIYVLAVTTTPKSWTHLQTLLVERKRIKAAIGLHPELVGERGGEVEEVCSIMPETNYVGEVGLDGSPGLRSTFDLQQKVFARVLARSAELGGRIISIHSRRAAGAVLDALEHQRNAGTPVLHWFSGSKQELVRAMALGCWFSVGPAMLESQRGRHLIEAMPRDKILTESDGPFARRGARALTPSDVSSAEDSLASLWGMSTREAQSCLIGNLRRLVGRD